MTARQPCAGGIVLDAQRRILLILRGNPPAQGTWSVPGGRCHDGESGAAACVREVAEETGLAVEVVRWVGRVERAAPDGGVYVIDDFQCRARATADTGDERPSAPPVLRPNDDALDARWVTRAELDVLPLAPGLLDALNEWDLLPD